MSNIIVVSGAIANKPFNGGEPWIRLTWALGLRRLGFHVYFVEQLDPRQCIDAQGEHTDFEQSWKPRLLSKCHTRVRPRGIVQPALRHTIWGLGMDRLRAIAAAARRDQLRRPQRASILPRLVIVLEDADTLPDTMVQGFIRHAIRRTQHRDNR